MSSVHQEIFEGYRTSFAVSVSRRPTSSEVVRRNKQARNQRASSGTAGGSNGSYGDAADTGAVASTDTVEAEAATLEIDLKAVFGRKCNGLAGLAQDAPCAGKGFWARRGPHSCRGPRDPGRCQLPKTLMEPIMRE